MIQKHSSENKKKIHKTDIYSHGLVKKDVRTAMLFINNDNKAIY